ncbi:MAG: MalY/PatB family protein [Solirubrobacteraceae bacterium]
MSQPTAVSPSSGPLQVPAPRTPSLRELHTLHGHKWATVDPDVISMTVAEMDFPLAPAVADALRRAIDQSDLGYALAAPRALVDSLTAFAARRLNWAIDPDQVRVVPDVVVGLVELCRAATAPEDGIGFATPAYPPFYTELGRLGRPLVELGLTPDGGLVLDDLDRALASGMRVLVLSNPHNPTGRVLPREEMEAIAERCAAAGAWVLADEVHAPLVLPGATHLPWLEVSDAARRCGIALTAASKAFNLAALKTAFIITADTGADGLVNRLGPHHHHASLLGEIAAEAAFRDGDTWLDAVIAQLDDNRTRLDQLLAERLPKVSWRPPQGTYLAWLDCRALELPGEPAEIFLQHGRVALGHGPDFGRAGEGHVRLNFATGSEHLDEAIRRMAAVH